jgi:hypothetical protein
MRKSLIVSLLGSAATAFVVAGCSSMSARNDKAAATAALEPQHPAVVIQGIDGTTMAGELLNGSVTVDSGQGELTLLTDHIHSILIAGDVDKLESESIKVSGKVKDTRFFLKNEHGVFTLSKDRLRKIEFVNNPPRTTATVAGGGTTSVGAVRAAGGTTSSPSR